MITDKIKATIVSMQKMYPEKRSALIPALHVVQAEIGYLPLDVQKEIAELFDIDPNEVNSVVTFYDMFHEKPIGKHVLHVCKNVSCMLRGCDDILSKLCEKLEITCSGTSKDGQFTVIPSECLGACDKAPVMIVDDKVVGNVKRDDLDKIIDDAKKGPGHTCPVPSFEVKHG